MLRIANLSEKKYVDPTRMGNNDTLGRFVDDYEVWANGELCDVSACRVSAMPYNRLWPGHERPLDQTELASYVVFSADEAVTLRVKCKRSFEKAVIRPLSKGIVPERCGDELTFTMEKPGQLVLELDGEHYALHIFFNPLLQYEQADIDNATYYFGPGIHHEWMITLKSNESIYVDENAILYSDIRAAHAENIRIFGGGVIKGSRDNRITGHDPNGLINLKHCKNVRVEDVILQDSCGFAVMPSDCDGMQVHNVKVIGQWRYNSDGISMGNCINVDIRDCFFRTFDDVFSMGGMNDALEALCNVCVENCVIWCGWHRCLQIGWGLGLPEARDIVFRNCDIIHCFSAMDILNGHYAVVHDIVYENINVEFQKDQKPMVFQEADNIPYPADAVFTPTLIYVDNYKYAANYGTFASDVGKDAQFGLVHDIHYKNIHVYLEEGCRPMQLHIHSQAEDTVHYNLFIEDMYVNGEKVTSLDGFTLDIKNAQLPIVR